MSSNIPSIFSFTPQQYMAFCLDAWQRTVLFGDVLCQRGDQYHQLTAEKTPNSLSFNGEVVLDGRTLPRPVNYGLVAIIPSDAYTIDPLKRPFVVIDPRAGHGPGIGGFKAESEIGVALRAGHPCYFIGFTPQPQPGQTIEDVMHAEAAFLEEVIRRHPEAEGKPCVIGNCQAGWAVMMLAATRPELCGPLIIPGAPLSFWAGKEGENPMRYSGGLLGGSWLTTLTSDLSNGKFDGAWLVSNFENLDPANTWWKKLHNVWAKVDTEAPRFLEFEKWWSNHVTLNGEEIQWMVDNLFIGNYLASAEIITKDGVRVDLRKIRSPILCFCSKGDNITPPQQALGWITDLYQKDEQIVANGQTIIYAIHDSVGHLGIFVSGKVADKEHAEFTSNIDLIDILPPGLYQAVMTPKSEGMVGAELVDGEWVVQFEPRSLADVRAIVQPSAENERRFASVRRVSEINRGLYRLFGQPMIKAFSNEYTAAYWRAMQPLNWPFEVFSSRNPMMQPVKQLAKIVNETRQPVDVDNPFWQLHADFSDGVVSGLNQWRDWRDSHVERLFLALYDNPFMQALTGLGATDTPPRPLPGYDPDYVEGVHQQIARLKSSMAEGDATTAAIRALVYIMMDSQQGVDERAFRTLLAIRHAHERPSLAVFKQLVREQFFRLKLDEDNALAAIPELLPATASVRAEVLAKIKQVISAGEIEAGQSQRMARIEALFKKKSASTIKQATEDEEPLETE